MEETDKTGPPDNNNLDVYRVRDWKGEIRVATEAAGVARANRQTGTLLGWEISDRAVAHRSPDGSKVSIEVVSHRSGGVDDFETLKNWAPVNSKLAAMRDAERRSDQKRTARAFNREFDDWRQRFVQERTPWLTVDVHVDGTPTSFEALVFEDHRVAVARSDCTDLIIRTVGVPIGGLALQRIIDPPPLGASSLFDET